MKKISELNEIGEYTGSEVAAIVQSGDTRKAFPLFTDSNMKVHMPESSALVTKVEGVEINLLSAKVVDGVVTVFVGDKEVSLYRDNNIIVTEPTVTDGVAYVRINNKWTARNPVTQVSGVSAPAGGGPITLSASHVKAHIENTNRDGKSYVSRDGKWIDITLGMGDALSGKSDVGHSHEIGDITGLQTALNAKANTSHTHTIAQVTGLQTALDAVNKSVTDTNTKLSDLATKEQKDVDGKADKVHTHTTAQVTGLDTKLSNLDKKTDTTNQEITNIKSRLDTAFFYSKDSAFAGTDASGKLPITMKRGLKASVTDNVISFEEAGNYFIQLIVNITSDGTVVTMDGVSDMNVSGKGYCVVSGVFDIATSTKISLSYTGANSTVESNIIIHRI